MRLYQLGGKYKIQIPLNVCGYGVALLHLSGGGGVLLNAKKSETIVDLMLEFFWGMLIRKITGL